MWHNVCIIHSFIRFHLITTDFQAKACLHYNTLRSVSLYRLLVPCNATNSFDWINLNMPINFAGEPFTDRSVKTMVYDYLICTIPHFRRYEIFMETTCLLKYSFNSHIAYLTLNNIDCVVFLNYCTTNVM